MVTSYAVLLKSSKKLKKLYFSLACVPALKSFEILRLVLICRTLRHAARSVFEQY